MALGDVRDAVDRAISRWGKRRVAILLGTSTGGLDATEAAYRAWAETGALPDGYRLDTRHDFIAKLRIEVHAVCLEELRRRRIVALSLDALHLGEKLAHAFAKRRRVGH